MLHNIRNVKPRISAPRREQSFFGYSAKWNHLKSEPNSSRKTWRVWRVPLLIWYVPIKSTPNLVSHETSVWTPRTVRGWTVICRQILSVGQEKPREKEHVILGFRFYSIRHRVWLAEWHFSNEQAWRFLNTNISNKYMWWTAVTGESFAKFRENLVSLSVCDTTRNKKIELLRPCVFVLLIIFRLICTTRFWCF